MNVCGPSKESGVEGHFCADAACIGRPDSGEGVRGVGEVDSTGAVRYAQGDSKTYSSKSRGNCNTKGK
jgi:hypothetical protein